MSYRLGVILAAVLIAVLIVLAFFAQVTIEGH